MQSAAATEAGGVVCVGGSSGSCGGSREGGGLELAATVAMVKCVGGEKI